MKLLKMWFMKPAKWYYFWLPQSGLAGGIIVGLIIVALLRYVFFIN